MRITGLEVDGYGVWSGLKLEGLSEGLNVLYGPNEAGKTTLMQFVRSVLYGFSPSRQKYFPPVRGGRPGGSIDVAGPNGRFHLDRHHDENGEHGRHEQIVLTAADGTRQGEHLVKVLLSGMDEAIYNNVFAVGLRELQELGTLSDTEAAESLYSLTAGLDRVSLVEVMRELETSRNRILDGGGGPCRVVGLLQKREKLRQEIEELGKLTRRYGRLAGERDQMQREVARLEEENSRTENQARVAELAITLRERWQQRAALDDQLAALGPPSTMPEGAVDRLDAINARLQKHQQALEQLRHRREELRAEASELDINEALWRQAARIEALREQEPWITTLRNQAGELEAEIAELQTGLGAEQQRLGLGNRMESGSLPVVSARSLASLRPPARALKQCRLQLDEAKQEVATANEQARALSDRIDAALAARNQRDLAAGMETAGNLVAQLRRRVAVDERLDQMTRYQRELEEQGRHLVDRQLLPVWVLLGLGAVFVLGVVLVLAGLFMPGSITGSVGWAMALLGLAGVGAAGLSKVLLERSNTRQLDTAQKQISMLQLQIQQAKEDRDALDEQLPRGGGPLSVRLEAAEKELAALEELAPLDTRRVAARQESEAAAARAGQTERDLTAARRRWSEALQTAGLPGNLAPKQVRELLGRCDQIGRMQRQLQQRREEFDRRRSELDALASRIAQLVVDTGVTVAVGDPVEQLRRLGEALERQENHVQRRDVLRRQARLLRRKRAKREEAVSRLKHLRRELLRESGAGDEQEFRQQALQAARAEVLQKERDAVAREIAAAIGGDCPEEAVGQHLENHSSEQLEALLNELLERLTALDDQLRERFEKRGRLAEQLKALAEDRQMAQKQLELAMLQKQLDEALTRWQVLAVTSRVLDTIRTIYEQERQPETLQEASGYLDRLTRGRYRRVWTPLSEDVLRVDDAQGNALSVEMLSRGTREQLFLALRLALAASYARRGAALPLVLDDVLVNFDAGRAEAAASVLRDFAAAGHQLLVFTCHEHILKLFESLDVPVSCLPDSAEADRTPISFEQPAKQKRKRAKKSEPPPAVVEEPEEEPPADEIAAIEDDAVSEEIVAAEPNLFEPPEEKPELDEEEDVEEEEAAKPAGVFDADFYDTGEAEEESEEEDEYEEEEQEDEEEYEDDEYEEDEYEDDEYGDGDAAEAA